MRIIATIFFLLISKVILSGEPSVALKPVNFHSKMWYASTTNLYFEASGVTYGGHSSFGTWTNTGSAIFSSLNPSGSKTSTTIASTTLTVNNSSSTASTCFGQFISPSLVAQTFSGTVTGYMRMSVSNATGCTAQSAIQIFIVGRDGTVKTALTTLTSGVSNLTTTLTSYQIANALALTGYTCADGDRLVIEVGIKRSSGTTSRTGSLSFGSSSSTDISAAGSTTANNPVITFSNPIIFYQGVN